MFFTDEIYVLETNEFKPQNKYDSVVLVFYTIHSLHNLVHIQTIYKLHIGIHIFIHKP